MLLNILLLAIFFSSLLVYFISPNQIKKFSLTMSIFFFLLSLSIFFNFDTLSGFQYVTSFKFIPFFGITFTIGVDSLSLFFIILTSFIMPLTILSTWNSIKIKTNIFYMCIFFVEFFLILAFSSLDLFFFFFSFESVLIPVMFIIGIWGQRTRKIRAVFYFFFYTFVGSIFMLVSILYINIFFGTTNYLDIIYSPTLFFSKKEQLLLWLGFFFSFAAKIPMYPFHIWLPEAHVEAPTSGSMILAGLLLKLGGYGFIRFSLSLFPYASFYYSSFIYTLAIISIIYSSCIALIQTDFKKLIAYSSIAHMNMSVLGIFSNNFYGLYGAYLIMLAHGIISVGLFFLVGCIYERYHERSIEYYGGLTSVSPIFSFFFFLFITSNFAFPYSLNFLGEVFIILGVYKTDFLVLLLLIFSSVVTVAYNIYFYEKLFFGTLNIKFGKIFMDMTKREIFIITPLFILSFILFLKPMIIISYLNFSCIY